MVAKYASNIIRMRNWIACSIFSILFSAILLFGFPHLGQAQNQDYVSESGRQYFVKPKLQLQAHQRFDLGPSFVQDTAGRDPNGRFPDPKSVMYKSMIIPGWGQIVNKQIWKVPIVYGLLGGLGYYSVYLNKKYHDYRAAYYNLNSQSPGDFRFGRTPAYIPESTNPDELQTIRNTYHNQRDMVYVGIVLAYGLNILDAYVFAHMRSFDVSEDLSMRTSFHPNIMAQRAPGVTLTFDLIRK